MDFQHRPADNWHEHNHGAIVLAGAIADLPAKLAEISWKPTFIAAYASPHLDINEVAAIINSRFPLAPKLICSTAGELYNQQGELYCQAETYWDHVVVQCFPASIIANAQIVRVPLNSEDLHQGKVATKLTDRIDGLKRQIEKLQVDMVINHHDTLAYVVFDGLSKSESFFMEALYASDRFPCLFVGGSAGGKSDFTATWLHDGQQALENHVLIAFLKTAPGIRFGILKSQNFIATATSFSILSASVEKRQISQVIDQNGQIASLIDALCETFGCHPLQLNEAMADYSFAIPLGDELFIRSASRIDTEMDLVHFYCDVSPGEKLILVRRKKMAECTARDFTRFMADKPGPPIAGILNDCILRRQLNKDELPEMGNILTGKNIAGFSTFGEILGLYLNQTLTGIFFFHVPENFHFKDDYIDNFILHYSEFKSFFFKRQIAKLEGLSKIVVRQLNAFSCQQYERQLDPSGLDSTMGTIFVGLNDLGKALRNIDAHRQLQTNEIEEKLRTNEERFRLLAESSITGIYLFQDGRFSYVNDSFANMFGYGVSEILNNVMLETLIAPEDRARVTQNIRERIYGESQTIRYSFRAMRKNGSTFHVEVHGGRIHTKEGIGIIGTLIDITEQKNAEASLQASEQRYRTLYNENPSMFFTVSIKGQITAVNDFAANQLGYAKDALLGRQFVELCKEDERQAVADEMANSLRAPGKTFQLQHRKIRGDNNLMWVEEFLRAVPGRDEQLHILVVCHDISKRKQLEESLKLTQFIFDEASVGIYVLDDESHIIDVNAHAYLSLGYTREELCSLTVPEIDPFFDRQRYNELIHNLNSFTSETFETYHKRKTGEIFPVQIFISSLRYNNRDLRVAFVQDVSEREQARLDQEKLENQLRQVQKLEAIGRLAGGVAHDLNNLLTPILGYAELLSFNEQLEKKSRDKLQQISKAATGAKDLVKQLLAFGRKQVMEYHPLDLNVVVEEFSDLIRRTVRENIDISIDKTADTVLIMADRGQIEQVLLNLIVNASDAMPDGGQLHIETGIIELDRMYAQPHPDLEPGIFAMLAISDTGEGMDQETQAKIFEPFFSTKGAEGTGLGLATVYGIVKQHDGSIWVYSEPGSGTTFKVYLPIADQQATSTKTKTEEYEMLTGTETILLVEDNQAVRNTVFDILKEKGYRVIAAQNGEDAENMVAKGAKPDLLLTDVVMPGMNGKELFQRLNRSLSALKVLYMSGYTDNIIVHHGVLEKKTHFIQKPFSSMAILDKVREVLNN